jgi:hypothetical protein
MAVKRSKKKVSKAYEQAMVAEGAPVALDLLGFGSAIGDILRGRSRKQAAKPRAKKKSRAKPKSKAKTVRAKKKTAAGKSRRKKK